MAYASYTRNTPDLLKRFAHGKRFKQIVKSVARPHDDDVILDYGCADAHLFSAFVGVFPRDQLYGYDPDPKMLSEVEPAIRAGANICGDIDQLLRDMRSAFTLIYCVEVCEHMTKKSMEALLVNVKSLAKQDARIIFGVPIETGLTGLFKNVYRTAKGRRQGATLAKAFRALVAAPIERVESDVDWYGSHIGFDHKRFKHLLMQRGFVVEREICLPLPAAGTIVNNEIYFICSISDQTRASEQGIRSTSERRRRD